ncbi:hypothetical protein Fmac_006468 [Flemingia macrophylla]|uniref:Apple domain-containing protein n=1 Tax=Flemingia macrophylla TaxID=520843 RepID=A0ABD1NC63_9FABA
MLGTHEHPNLIAILLLLLTLETTLRWSSAATSIAQELEKGFWAAPESSTASFQAVMRDPSGNFSLGFLRVNEKQLFLAILHVASAEALWVANPRQAASWSGTTRLLFNGSLVLTDPKTRLSWSTATNGDRAVLLNNSNLQVQSSLRALWESFHSPTNTLVEGQNFTSAMALVSANGLYSLRLGDDFMGLYDDNQHLLYWKHSALETKTEIKQGQGPIYARVNSQGYLGMYQTNDKLPADVQKFNSFQQSVTSTSFLFIRLEPDGNLRGYYWDGSNWLLNYRAISETCDLPRPCGSYALCTPGGSACSCLDNRTRFEPGGGCSNTASADSDFCGEGNIGGRKSFRVVRRSGVDPPHKESLSHVTTSSLVECEALCQNNCSCWGALYSNSTGFCYLLDLPIQTMLGTGDGSKVGYFKFSKGEGGKKRVWVRVGVVVVVTVLVMVGVVVMGGGVCVRRWKKRKEDDWASPGPYKNLGSASFRSIEMSSSSGG